MNKTLFVINPASGGQEKDDLVDLIKATCQEGFIYFTSGNKDQEKIREILQKDQYDRVIAGGGDGTIAMVANEILNDQIDLGIIPMGSANGLAKELSIPLQPREALEKAIKKPGKPFDIIAINNKWHVLHMADFGMNAKLVRRYQDDHRRGFLGYAISGLKELPNLMTVNSFELASNNESYHMESAFVVIANARRYGTGIEINPSGRVNDGKFEICCLQTISFENFLTRFINEEEFELNPFEILSTSQAKIKLKEKTDFQIDGEYIGETDQLDIHIKKGAIQLVY